MKTEVYLAGGVRTAIGCFSGMFAEVPATQLGSVVARAALKRAQVSESEVDEVIFGNVIGAGLGPNPARVIALGAGLADRVGATSVNKVCGSGLKAVMLAAQAIQSGDAGVLVAGGAESMSRAPYLLEKARSGYRMGHGELLDSMLRDGLWDSFSNQHMGALGEQCAGRCEFSREAQDDFAVASYERALQADKDGIFAGEITPVEVVTRKGTNVWDKDEEAQRFNEEKLRKLRPAFDKGGTITAGNASSISDGAAAVVVLASDKARTLGVEPQAKILGYATHSREPEWFTLAPVQAIQSLMQRLSWTVDDVDLFEVNEAFAVVPMAAMKELNIPHEKINVHGGAISLGHPIGASGARILSTLLNALRVRGLKTGIASLCIGGGEAVAMAVERIENSN